MTYQTASRRVIPIMAPPAPKCFPTRDVWVSFLQSAQSVPRASERPFQGERYRPTFNFCRECPAHYREQMEREARCDLDAYVANLLAGQNQTPTTQVVAEGVDIRPEPDATVPPCAAYPGEGSATDSGLGVKVNPNRSIAQPVPQGKSQRGCETPAGACTPAGLCAGANP